MKTKLTLTIEQSIIEKAKRYSQKTDVSLSHLIENYLRALTSDEISTEDELSPTVKLLKGSFKQTEKLDYKDGLVNRLSDKYL